MDDVAVFLVALFLVSLLFGLYVRQIGDEARRDKAAAESKTKGDE